MTAPAPLLPARAEPTVYERCRAAMTADSARRRLVAWLAPALITLLAAVLRLWNLGHPQELVFDETYYVKDAWSQWNLGYAATWPDDADDRFAAGETDIFTRIGSFAVHPPLGKYLIGLGMWVLGPESAVGWRITAALAGTACVLVLYLLARTLTGSIAFASIAAYLMAIDGVGIVLSRVGLLDIFLTLFVLLAFWFVALDRDGRLRTLRRRAVRRRGDGPPLLWGPIVANRPWIVAAGAAAGAATAVKWSGLWVLAGLGIYLVVTDALERRRLGIHYWPMDAVRQGLVSFVLLVPVAAVVYLASWTGWLVTAGGYGRDTAESGLVALWTYHGTIYTAMAGMTSSHGYMSAAWQWPLLWRPTSMWVLNTATGDAGCVAANGCLGVITSTPNPFIWLGGTVALVWVVWRFALTRDRRLALVLTGVAVTWLPWLVFPERTVFQFYTIVMLPFWILALVFALRAIAGPAHAPRHRRASGQGVVLVFLVVVTLLSVFWYPLWTGVSMPYDFWRLHNWTPGWV